MKKINLYIGKQVTLVFVLAVLISTAIGLLGASGKIIRVMQSAEDVQLILQFVWLMLPKLLSFILPISLLLAVVLVFNRLSADREITALRASGVSIFQIIAPLILLGVLVSGFCWYLRFYLVPKYYTQAKLVSKGQVVENPMNLIRENSQIELHPGFFIIVGSKKDDVMYDVQIFQLSDDQKQLLSNITAESGTVSVDPVLQTMKIILYNVTTISFDKDKHGESNRIWAKTQTFQIKFGDVENKKRLVERPKYMTLSQLFVWIQMLSSADKDYSKHMKELNKRAAWALSPLTFLLIGIPLGLQIARKETSASIVGSVAMAAFYYVAMALTSETIDSKYHPEIFMWIFNIGLQIAGLFLIWKKR
ncbi:MAG: LptF/LptG family permease [Lentisphaeria bacterium]|nr:LptF/LptG family permease [Lentisphaeria bacterium]